ncbi:MAG TPA: glycine cleavage system aminomethyltransferase GcvT [Polyangiaceae bacterium]|nr:glycine cleavage system aminomethyltransferase GcvT [Polyangiaceae bacterium]
MTSSLRHTPVHSEHVRLGARLVPFAGYEMPIQYAGISEEHNAVRNKAGLFDVSHMGEIQVSGPAALATVDRIITGDLTRVADGQALYTCACNEGGTILDDLIVYRHGSSDVLVVCNASNREKMVRHFSSFATPEARIEDVSENYALLALQGPRAFDVLATLRGNGELASSLKSFYFTRTTLGSIEVTIARTGYTGEDGVELFVAPGKAAELFRALLDAGASHGIQPVGLGARDTLRLEARLSLYGNDIDETTNPLEAGLGWIVKLDKPDFVGKAALVAVRDQGSGRKLVGFEMTGRGIARHGYPLQDSDGRVIGVCTSGGPSPTLGKNIGLGYVETRFAEVGNVIQVDCRGKSVSAVVVRTPFYRRPR